MTGASDVQIIYIFYDGLVYRTESDEYVAIKNLGDAPQDLAWWELKDIKEGYQSFTFPHYILEAGETVRVYTNEIHPEWGAEPGHLAQLCAYSVPTEAEVVHIAQQFLEIGLFWGSKGLDFSAKPSVNDS